MENSILISTKKILSLPETYTPFDLDIVTHINAAFSSLDQLGVGPAGGFFIEDEAQSWEDIGLPSNQLNMVRSYVYLKARMLFDPPTLSFLIEAMNEQIHEYEWRLKTFQDDVIAQTEEV
jgi:hypothetical protein